MAENEPTYIEIESLDEFMEWVLELGSDQYLFRGLPNECYDIGEASAYRRLEGEENKTIAKLLEINRNLIKEARRQGHDKVNDRQLSDLELLGKLQHFRAATFLVDFTFNPQIALWFACGISSKESANGKVAAVRNSLYGIKEVLSDDLSKKIDDFFQPDEDEGYPLYQWQPTSIDNRIVRQHSVFLFGGAEIEVDAECVVSKDFKQKLRKNLEKFSDISADTLFPDFDGFVRQNSHDIAFNIPNYRGMGVQAYVRNEYSEAITNFDSAIRLDPKNANLYFLRGQVKRQMKQYEEAIADYDNSISLDSKSSNTYYWRGRIHSTIKQYAESIADYNKAISISSDISTFYYWRGIAKYHLEQYSDAIDDFNRATNLEPDSEYFYYWRALTKNKLGESRRAKQDFEMGLLLANKTNNIELINTIEEELSEIETEIDDIPF